MYLSWLGNSYYLLGRYDDAFATLSVCAERMPDYPSILVWLAAAAARAGRHHVARDAAAETMHLQPGFTIASWLDFIRLEPHDAANLKEGLRCAGLPD
jgi:predicted Zn-dependent protease